MKWLYPEQPLQKARFWSSQLYVWYHSLLPLFIYLPAHPTSLIISSSLHLVWHRLYKAHWTSHKHNSRINENGYNLWNTCYFAWHNFKLIASSNLFNTRHSLMRSISFLPLSHTWKARHYLIPSISRIKYANGRTHKMQNTTDLSSSY